MVYEWVEAVERERQKIHARRAEVRKKLRETYVTELDELDEQEDRLPRPPAFIDLSGDGELLVKAEPNEAEDEGQTDGVRSNKANRGDRPDGRQRRQRASLGNRQRRSEASAYETPGSAQLQPLFDNGVPPASSSFPPPLGGPWTEPQRMQRKTTPYGPHPQTWPNGLPHHDTYGQSFLAHPEQQDFDLTPAQAEALERQKDLTWGQQEQRLPTPRSEIAAPRSAPIETPTPNQLNVQAPQLLPASSQGSSSREIPA